MPEPVHPDPTDAVSAHRKGLAPAIHAAFETFSKAVFADGALPERTKQLVAVAVSHVTQCPDCTTVHTELALRKGATEQEIMEAIWVAAEMRAGGAYSHSTLAVNVMSQHTHDLDELQGS